MRPIKFQTLAAACAAAQEQADQHTRAYRVFFSLKDDGYYFAPYGGTVPPSQWVCMSVVIPASEVE